MTELVWEGKYRDGKRVAPVRIALPFQTVETVNESAQDRRRTLDLFASGKPTEWRNRLIWGDKKYVLPSLLPEFAGKVNLIYIDPPFDTGADFSFTTEIPETDEAIEKEPSMIEQKAYRDTWGVTPEERQRGVSSLDKYLRWFYETVVLLRDLLAEDGSIYVHLDWHVGHYAKLVLDEVFGEDACLNEVIWSYRRWPSVSRAYQSMHDGIYFYRRSEDSRGRVFNTQYEPASESYLRRFGGKTQVLDETTGTRKIPVDSPTKGMPLRDVWDISIIAGSHGERLGYPTQKPAALLDRIITVSSRPGDLILDCFCGSGTTAAVAEKLGRRWIACDLSRFAIHTTRKRLLGIPGVKPFVVQNLGKYERQAWMSAEFEKPEDRAATEAAYRKFILDLFRAEPVTGLTWLHGVKAGRMVHVGAVDAPVTLADVKAIAAEVWRAAGHAKNGPHTAAVDILGWEFAFELNETARQVAAEARVDVKFRRIPRDVLDKKAVEQGDIQPRDFFELRALSAKVTKKKRRITLEMTDFILPAEDLPEEIAKAVKHWAQWIDYWAVDWNYKDDTFHNEWQSYRTRKEPKLELKVEHEYPTPGAYTVVVKVIDILGNDTTKALAVEVD
ncbi:MAG: DNA methyltransferase [Myxococcota bacterium]|nr:DNA methyltransferase [Myxococcota bacterium]